MNFQFNDLKKIISDSEYNYSYLEEQLISKADFLEDHAKQFVKELILETFELFRIRFSIAENVKQIDDILIEQFEGVKAFINECHEFETLKKIQFLGNNIGRVENAENFVKNKLLFLKLDKSLKENQGVPVSKLVNTSIEMFEAIKFNLPTNQIKELENHSMLTGEENYFMDVNKILKNHRNFNGDLFNEITFTEYLTCFDLNKSPKTLIYPKGKKIQFIYFLSQINDEKSKPIVNDSIAERFGIKNYRQSKTNHNPSQTLLNKVNLTLK